MVRGCGRVETGGAACMSAPRGGGGGNGKVPGDNVLATVLGPAMAVGGGGMDAGRGGGSCVEVASSFELAPMLMEAPKGG